MTNKEQISYLRAISSLAIVVLHFAFSAVLTGKSDTTKFNLFISNSISNMLMWAVPCFVMVTGLLLLNPEKEIGYKKLFKNYIFRMVALLIAFSLIYKMFDTYMNGEAISINVFLSGLWKAITGTGWAHLWYIYMVISIYLTLPIYRRFIVGCKKNTDIIYFMIILLVFASAVPLLKYLDINLGFYIQITTIYSFYLVCGYAIGKGKVKLSIPLSWVLLFVTLILNVGITYVKWIYGNEKIDIFNNYYSIIIVIQSISVFNIFMNIKKKRGFIDKILLSLDKHSLGIYLVHMIFIRWLFRYRKFNAFDNGIVSIGYLLCIIIVSYIFVFIIKKIPFIKKYI